MLNSNSGTALQKGQIVDLLDLPDNIVFASDAVQITNVDVPLYLPDGTIGGKARVVEGDDDEVSVLVEIESTNPMVADLFKGDIIGISVVHRDRSMPGTFIELTN